MVPIAPTSGCEDSSLLLLLRIWFFVPLLSSFWSCAHVVLFWILGSSRELSARPPRACRRAMYDDRNGTASGSHPRAGS